MTELGNLKHVEPREVWHTEQAFSAWLEENISRLSSALGLEIDLAEREVEAGDFAADLVGMELTSGRKIVIENQLGASNHDHLGKAITYASNLDGGVVVWIAADFRVEHRRALQWLNARTDASVQLFGVELRVVRVDESKRAVDFVVVAEPEERPVPETRRTPKQSAYLAFFSDLLAQVKKRYEGVTTAKCVFPQSWMSVPAGRYGFIYAFAFSRSGKFRVELFIDTGDKKRNEDHFEVLHLDAEAIESHIGTQLSWERLETKRACRIAAYTAGTIESPPDGLAELREWALGMFGRFREAFADRIKAL
jgi:hypothetical protein